ncbi:hypothetical protein MRX96_035127 [Rhipicephalus microplus]
MGPPDPVRTGLKCPDQAFCGHDERRFGVTATRHSRALQTTRMTEVEGRNAKGEEGRTLPSSYTGTAGGRWCVFARCPDRAGQPQNRDARLEVCVTSGVVIILRVQSICRHRYAEDAALAPRIAHTNRGKGAHNPIGHRRKQSVMQDARKPLQTSRRVRVATIAGRRVA